MKKTQPSLTPNGFEFEVVFKKYLRQPDLGKTLIIIGSKNIGKTYAVLVMLINRFKKYGEKFLIIRRSYKEAKIYGDDETRSHPVGNGCTYKNGIIYYQQYPMARVVGLTGSGEGRGKANDGYFNALFDDFIGKKYEPIIFNFSERLADVIDNFARNNRPKFRLYMTANLNHGRSEFLNFINFTIPKKGGFTELPFIKTVIYTENKATKEGMFALHNKDIDKTVLAGTKMDTKTYRFLLENQSQETTVLKISRTAVKNLQKLYIINVKDAYFDFGYSAELGVYILYELKNYEPKENQLIYSFDIGRLGQEGVTVPPNARELSKGMLDLLMASQLRITNLIYLPYFIKNIVQFIKRKDIVFDDEIN